MKNLRKKILKKLVTVTKNKVSAYFFLKHESEREIWLNNT